MARARSSPGFRALLYDESLPFFVLSLRVLLMRSLSAVPFFPVCVTRHLSEGKRKNLPIMESKGMIVSNYLSRLIAVV